MTPKRRRTGLRSGDTSLIGDVQQQITSDQLVQNQVISIDQNTIVPGANVLPLSLSVDAAGNITDSGLTAQILQGLDGVQLQLGQGIQITGLDPNLVNQTLQIDASVLQQLQGNVNLTINPNIVTHGIQTADPNLVQAVNPNIIIQQGGMQQTSASTNESATDVQQVAVQSGLDESAVVASGSERQIVTLQQQQGGLQQVTLQSPQMVQTADGLTIQPAHVENIQGEPTIAPDIVAPASPGENSNDEIEDKGIARDTETNEHLVADEGNIVLSSTTDPSVLDEQKEPTVTGQDQNLIQAHTIVTVTPGDTDRTHVCHVSIMCIMLVKKLNAYLSLVSCM